MREELVSRVRASGSERYRVITAVSGRFAGEEVIVYPGGEYPKVSRYLIEIVGNYA
ncbi:hypothetical protein GCM10023339_69890 [Alloalcanivorax gelatiniphagus]